LSLGDSLLLNTWYINQKASMIRALIVDDELHCRENLQLLVKDFCPEVELVGTAHSATSAREVIESEKIDLVFLDIMMPSTDGFQLLESLEKRDFAIVFTTAHSEFALKAIKAGAIDYLQKPIDISELQEAVKRVALNVKQSSKTEEVETTVRKVLHEMGLNTNSSNSEIAIPTRNGLEIVRHKDIVRLEGNDSYTTIYLQDGRKFLSSKTIKVYEDHLPSKYFFRVHKSHVVNLSYLKAYTRIDGNIAILTTGDQVPVARRKLQNFLDRVQSF